MLERTGSLHHSRLSTRSPYELYSFSGNGRVCYDNHSSFVYDSPNLFCGPPDSVWNRTPVSQVRTRPPDSPNLSNVALVKRVLFLLFWERRRTRQRAQCNIPSWLLAAMIDKAYQFLAGKMAVRCLLLTANAADNKHHAPAISISMFETDTRKANRRHPTPFPNTNEVECMPATSLHDLPFMHNTLSELQSVVQIVAGRASDVVYSLIRIRVTSS